MKYFYEIGPDQSGIYFRQYVHDINIYRFNWHKEIELTLMLKGSSEFSVEGTTYTMEEDDLLLINSNCGHGSMTRTPGSLALVLRFHPDVFLPLTETPGDIRFDCRSDAGNRRELGFDRIRYYMARMILALSSDSPFGRQEATGSFLLLAADLLNDFPHQMTADTNTKRRISHQKAVRSVIDFMENHFAEKITLDEAAQLTGYNRTYLSSFFKNNIGINFYEYLTRIRLRHALHELNVTDKPVTEIAENSGFPDLKAFNATFRRYFYELPSRYRQLKTYDKPVLEYENQRNYLDPRQGGIVEKLDRYLCFGNGPASYVDSSCFSGLDVDTSNISSSELRSASANGTAACVAPQLLHGNGGIPTSEVAILRQELVQLRQTLERILGPS